MSSDGILYVYKRVDMSKKQPKSDPQRMLAEEIAEIRRDIQKEIRTRQRDAVNRLVYRIPIRPLPHVCDKIEENDVEMKDHK
jgi:hypothetical protein